nr:hypothetical protein Itr_chr02CG11500 [Ipomoea trifida]
MVKLPAMELAGGGGSEAERRSGCRGAVRTSAAEEPTHRRRSVRERRVSRRCGQPRVGACVVFPPAAGINGEAPGDGARGWRWQRSRKAQRLSRSRADECSGGADGTPLSVRQLQRWSLAVRPSPLRRVGSSNGAGLLCFRWHSDGARVGVNNSATSSLRSSRRIPLRPGQEEW